MAHDSEVRNGEEQRKDVGKKRKDSSQRKDRSEVENRKLKRSKAVAEPVKVDNVAIRDPEAEVAHQKRNIGEKKSQVVEEPVGSDIVIYDSEPGEGEHRNVTKRIIEDPTKSNVIYVGRIPHGLYEKQMREFFGQFGTISKLRISRNKKTGKSKHYGFIKFKSPEVAVIAAESMNNYLLFESLLQVTVFPVEKQHPNMWIGANRAKPEETMKKVFSMRKILQTRGQTPAEQKQKLHVLLRKDHKKREKLKAAGIEFDIPNLRNRLPRRPKKTKLADE